MTSFHAAGAEFLVNSQTVSHQVEPTITGLTSGGFVVSWYTYDPAQDGSGTAIRAQIYDAAGAMVGAEFLVNSQMENDQIVPAITGLTNGGFVVSWTTYDPAQDGSSGAIKAQIYDAAGAMVGTEFLVNSQASTSQEQQSITGLTNGGFVVSWMTLDQAQDGSAWAVKAQIFDAVGAKSGAEFLVNRQVENQQVQPVTTGLTNGGFVVSWWTLDEAQDGSGSAIKAQIYDADGNTVGAEFLINSQTPSDQLQPTITGLTNGGFVVSWWTNDGSQDGSGTAIKAQIYDAFGAIVGAEFLVNSQTLSDQKYPTVTGLADGGFIVSWTSFDSAQDGSEYAIKVQIFDATGTKIGAEFLANTQMLNGQYLSTITGLTNGGFVVSWTTNDAEQDGSGNAIKAQIYLPDVVINTAPALTGEPALLVHGSEDTAYDISAADLLSGYTDVDGDKLGIANLSADHGTIALNADGSFTLTPDQDYFGTITLSYAVIDGKGGTTAASRNVEFDPLNDAPVIKAPLAVTVAENLTGTVLTIGGYDPDAGATTQFSLGGADAGLFNFDSNSGALSFKQTPDYESPADNGLDNVYDLTVTLTDGTLSSSQALTITVSDVAETGSIFNGGSGADRLVGTSGNDFIFGGNGADQVTGSDGDDLVLGGSGNDVISGGRGGDLLYGDAGHDVLDGGLGNDGLYGGSGNDSLTGGAGDDKLFGDQGKDILIGGDGNDLLVGGESKDTLTGNGGADIFVLGHTAAGADLVMDFEVGVDKIQFAAADFGLAAGPLDASMLVLGGKAVDHHAEFVYNEALGKLFWDADGVGGASAVIVATFDNKADLSAADFTLV
jgi:Ca2+-binding RTX toxin-like protein